MMKWEFIDMRELRLRRAVEQTVLEPDKQKVVVLPGFELAQVKQKPITDIIHCYGRITAAMATKFPDSTPGLMSHLLTVLRAYSEVENPAWRLYDIAYWEKMASKSTTTFIKLPAYCWPPYFSWHFCAGSPRCSFGFSLGDCSPSGSASTDFLVYLYIHAPPHLPASG